MITIMAYHGVPYVATANLAYLDDLERKVRRAGEVTGFRYLEIFISCVPGHKVPSASVIEMLRQMVRSKIWPLVEITNNGQKWTLWEPDRIISVEEALKRQGRFEGSVNYPFIQKEIDERWSRIFSRVRASSCVASPKNDGDRS